MTLSIGPATDYLYGLAQQAVTGITVNGKAMKANDGPSLTPVYGMFVINGVPDPEASADTTETRTWPALGAQKLEEDYVIPCYIDVRVPGDTQKTARDIAETAFNAFWALVKPNMQTLGGALSSRYAEITELTETASSVGTAAEPGCRHLIRFGVHCRNLTT